MPHPANPPAGYVVSVDANSRYDWAVGQVGQWYYGGLDMASSIIYLVASASPVTGQMATDPGTFRRTPQAGLHGQHGTQGQVIGYGHLNAMQIAFGGDMPRLKDHCGGFAIEKTGRNTFRFTGNSTLNEWSFAPPGNRAMPAAWHALLMAQLPPILGAAADEFRTPCVIS